MLVAGGNSFYEKRNRDGSLQNPVPQEPYNLALAYSPQSPSMPQDPSYDVTLPQVGPVPGTEPTVQMALAEAAKTGSLQQNDGSGPQARGDRLARHRDVSAGRSSEQHVQVASYQPNFDTSAPQAASLGYAPASQKQVDAIGALLLSQNRPEAPL